MGCNTGACNNNVYLPRQAVIMDILDETPLVKTFVLSFRDGGPDSALSYEPGQFVMLSVPHHGEAPFSFSSTPTRSGSLELSIRKAGRLTSALHRMLPGMAVGIRGPYGRPFPMREIEGRDLLFVAGGIGLAPLRSVINYCLDRGAYGAITLLYGSRSPSDICFRKDIEAWSETPGMSCLLTVDQPDDKWDGRSGVVTGLLENVYIIPESSVAIVCGPPVMIKFVLQQLLGMGFQKDSIIVTLERHMKCGIGLCGHCHMGQKLVCTDGPVFRLSDCESEVLS